MTHRIRKLDSAECRTMVDWAAAEGWNPGHHDAHAFHATDPHGYWGLFEDDALIATISAVRYPSDFVFIGFYICRPDRRGKGHGLRLWEHALSGLDRGCVGLDGVVDQQANYRKSGFALAHRNIRCGGTPKRPAGDHRALRRLGVSDAASVAAHEQARRLFPSDRTDFLRAWFSAPGTVAYAIDDANGLSAYGAIRPCRTGWKIGPLFAGNYDDALAIARELVRVVPDGEQVFLDVPEPNEEARRLAAQLGLTQVFETARMYRGPAPKLTLDRIFGITSFELG
jgi:hypothetical protein